MTIMGRVDLTPIDVLVRQPIRISNSWFLGPVSIEGITFAKDAVFWGTAFGNACFEKAHFLGRADFSNASFGPASFAGCSFRQRPSLKGRFFRKT
jgi:uncharacterized protein YjbI with pentapeptide repeats